MTLMSWLIESQLFASAPIAERSTSNSEFRSSTVLTALGHFATMNLMALER